MRVPLATAAHICGVRPGTVRKWTMDKRVTVEKRWDTVRKCETNWYDVDELLTWIDSRDPRALYIRAGIRAADRPTTSDTPTR